MAGPFFTLSDLTLPTSPAQYLQQWLSQLQTQYPGYSPSAGSLEYIQAQVFSSFAADVAQLCTSGSQELFRTYGTKLIGLPYQVGAAASTIATVTATDTLGHTLPAGTQLTLTLAGAPLGFQTQADVTIAAGSATGTVTVVAVQNGTAFNGAGTPAQVVSPINWVQGVTVAASASGGIDQESDDHYLLRLANTLQLMAMRPITATDFANVAKNFTPALATDQQQVGRATCLDGYDPATNTFGNQREVTVVVADMQGNPLNSDTMYGVGGSAVNIVTNPASWGIAGWLGSLREANFVINVQAPQYTTVYVAVTVKGAAGWLPATVQANVQSTLLSLLSPANFGRPDEAATSGWASNSTTVWRSRVEAAIQFAPGVDHLVTGTLAIDVNPNPTNTTNDLVLAGAVPLPVTTTTSVPISGITVL